MVWKLVSGIHDEPVKDWLRKNHSGMLRAVVGGRWLVVGKNLRTRRQQSPGGGYQVVRITSICHPDVLLVRIWFLILSEDGSMIWDGQRRTALI